MTRHLLSSSFFFFNDTATTEIYTLSLHDALPISRRARLKRAWPRRTAMTWPTSFSRSEEHTSELQSPCNLVCRLLLEKKKKTTRYALQSLLGWIIYVPVLQPCRSGDSAGSYT